MLNRFRPVLTCAVWLTATAAMAQGAPPPTQAGATVFAEAPVIVQASPFPRSETVKRSRSFVRTYAAPTAHLEQVARWRGSVCVLVLGLVPEQAAQVARRIEDVAKAVGLRVDRSGCKANIEIVFSDQPQAVLDWVADRSDWVLGYHYASQTQAVKTVTRPIQPWYMTATQGFGGDNGAMAFAAIGNDAGARGLSFTKPTELVDAPNNGTPSGCAGSKFTSCLRTVFKNVLVVVDNGRVRNQPLGPVTDYLAMLTLSQPSSLDGCLPLTSVIDLFAPAACPGRPAPDGLTGADAAYLTALYASNPEAKTAAQQSEIAHRMARILANATPVAQKVETGADTSASHADGH